MSNKNSIFRKSSLDRMSSPEQLNEYIKVSRPSVWLILVAVAVLLVGVVVWSVLGTLNTTREMVAVTENGTTTCYVSPELAGDLATGMPVQIGNKAGVVSGIATTPIAIPVDFNPYALHLGKLKEGDFVVPIGVDIAVEDGVYSAKIILESISPISFVLN